MAEERENQQAGYQGAGQPDVEGHSNHPRSDDADPDELKLKLANDEDDDDVEGHSNHPSQTAG
jgi:hypothetical protein